MYTRSPRESERREGRVGGVEAEGETGSCDRETRSIYMDIVRYIVEIEIQP